MTEPKFYNSVNTTTDFQKILMDKENRALRVIENDQ